MSKPVALDDLKAGDKLEGDAAPQIADTAFTIFCTVETSQPDAVLIAHGGLAAGYALHLKGGRVFFTFRTGGEDAFTEIGSSEVISGKVSIAASLASDRTLALRVNDKVVATGKAGSLPPRQPMEDFCIGHDNGKPVAAYTATGQFKGSITGLKFSTP